MPVLKRLIPATFVVLWSSGFIGARYAMPWAEPFTFLAGRFVLAFAVLALLALFVRARRISRHDAFHSAIAGALMHGIYLGGVFWAIRQGLPAGIASIIASLQPLITAVFAGRILGEKITPRHWAGLGAGFTGVAIVLSPAFGVSGITWATLTAAFVAMAGMTAGTIWQKKFATGGGLITGTICQYLGGAALMIVASFAFETQAVTINGELIFAMVWLVLVLSIGAIFLLMLLIREGAMSKVSSLFYLVPVVTALMAWALFDEQLTMVQLGGMALASFGVGLATAQRPARASAATG